MASTAISSQGTKFEIETATASTFVEIGNVKAWSGFDGSASEIDVTNLASTAKEFRAGLQDFGKLSLTINPNFDDTGQTRCRALRASGEVAGMKVTYEDGSVATFDVVVLSMPQSGGVDNVIDGSIDFRITGDVTIA